MQKGSRNAWWVANLRDNRIVTLWYRAETAWRVARRIYLVGNDSMTAAGWLIE